uniref:Uncharacterized protein n=1 Tax=Arion vulgaris TaxID=1028688 RepID=A0A0B6Y8X5_9EUPU
MHEKQTHRLVQTIWGTVLFVWTSQCGIVALEYTTQPSENTTAPDDNDDDVPTTCPEPEKCQLVVAVLTSLLAGFILGVTVTYVLLLFRRTRKQAIPPKDYDVRESSHFDVNRNNDEIVDFSTHAELTPADQGVKEHKKLERLFKKHRSSPGNVEVPTSSLPLIQGADRAHATTAVDTSSGRTNMTNLPGAGQDGLYANVGAAGALSQPYDVLDIILEESEYESSKGNNSETNLQETSPTK